MKTATRPLALALIALTAMTGCASQGYFKAKEIGPEVFAVTDASLRVIATQELSAFSVPGQADPERIICTEPSPDVAKAMASSFGASLSVFAKGNAALSGSQIEALAQLVERTASIQLLRDKMYQTCLAYANGAISGTNYSLIMSKLDETIVTLMLGETAGGAFGRSLAALGTEADSDATTESSGLADAMAKLDELTTQLVEMNTQIDTLAQELAELEKLKPADDASDDVKNAHQESVDKKKQALAAAKAKRGALLELARTTSKAASTSGAKTRTVTSVGALSAANNVQVSEILSNMQEEFLLDDFSQDLISACLVEMSNDKQLTNKRDEATRRLASELAKARLRLNEFACERTPCPHGGSLDMLRSEVDRLSKAYTEQLRANAENEDKNANWFEDKLREVGTEPEVDAAESASLALSNYQKVLGSKTSKLSRFCDDYLNDFFYDAGDRNHQYRLRRLELEADVKKLQSKHKTVTVLDTFTKTLDYCEKHFKDDAVKRDRCIETAFAAVGGPQIKKSPANQASTGIADPMVAWAQSALNALMDAGLKVDGKFGKKTQAALKKFQKDNGLTESGVMDEDTLATLKFKLQSA